MHHFPRSGLLATFLAIVWAVAYVHAEDGPQPPESPQEADHSASLISELRNDDIQWGELSLGFAGPEKYLGSAELLKNEIDRLVDIGTSRGAQSGRLDALLQLDDLSAQLETALADEDKWVAAHILLTRAQRVRNNHTT